MKSWLKLVISIAIIVGFIKIVPRILSGIEVYHLIQESSEAHNIDNNSLFYSEEAISYEAEKAMKEKLKNRH